MPVADHIVRYVLRLVRATRIREASKKPAVVENYVSWGAGPRASQYIVLAAKAKAILSGATHVMPEHIRLVALPVMRHRIITNYTAEAEGYDTDRIIDHVLEALPVSGGDESVHADLRQVLDS